MVLWVKVNGKSRSRFQASQEGLAGSTGGSAVLELMRFGLAQAAPPELRSCQSTSLTTLCLARRFSRIAAWAWGEPSWLVPNQWSNGKSGSP